MLAEQFSCFVKVSHTKRVGMIRVYRVMKDFAELMIDLVVDGLIQAIIKVKARMKRRSTQATSRLTLVILAPSCGAPLNDLFGPSRIGISPQGFGPR